MGPGAPLRGLSGLPLCDRQSRRAALEPETPPPLACVEYTEPPSIDVSKQRRWLCGKKTDVHVCPGIDLGRPSVSVH